MPKRSRASGGASQASPKSGRGSSSSQASSQGDTPGKYGLDAAPWLEIEQKPSLYMVWTAASTSTSHIVLVIRAFPLLRPHRVAQSPEVIIIQCLAHLFVEVHAQLGLD